MKTTSTQNTYGLKKFGYINNFSAQLAQFNHLLQGTGKTLKTYDVDTIVDPLVATNLNSYGCNNFHGTPIDEEHAAYKVINTGVKTISGEDIVGLFVRNRKRNTFEGVTWTTWRGIRMEITLISKPHMGEIYFASKDAFNSFLESVAESAVPEPWNFSGNTCSCKYPILRSYLENIFGKLRKEAAEGKENKVVYSADGQHILFNTNLPDTFGNDILILAEVRKKPNGEEYFENPSMSKSGIYGRRQYGFRDEAKPEPATFFEDVNEVIFQSNWQIDANFDHLFHIIKENSSRLPKEYQ